MTGVGAGAGAGSWKRSGSSGHAAVRRRMYLQLL